MKPSLQDQLAMVWRTENPNYIILIKNKAGANMDFSQFKVIQENKKEIKEKIEPRYLLTINNVFGGIIVSVKDLFEGTTPLRIETTENKKEYWERRCKKEYKPLKYDTQRYNQL